MSFDGLLSVSERLRIVSALSTHQNNFMVATRVNYNKVGLCFIVEMVDDDGVLKKVQINSKGYPDLYNLKMSGKDFDRWLFKHFEDYLELVSDLYASIAEKIDE